VAEHKSILKNDQNTYYPRFSFIPKTGTAFPKTGVLFLPCKEHAIEIQSDSDHSTKVVLTTLQVCSDLTVEWLLVFDFSIIYKNLERCPHRNPTMRCQMRVDKDDGFWV